MATVPGTADVAGNVAAVTDRVRRAAERAGRRPEDVLLVAVSKTVGPERIRAAIDAGISALGENRVQEAREKIPLVGRAAAWHLIGHLQTNKVRDAVVTFDLIQSIDRLAVAEAVSARAVAAGRRLDGLVQVNVAEEEQKGGFRPSELEPALRAMAGLPGLRLRGLMTIPPRPDDPEASRPYYRQLGKLLEAARSWGLGSEFRELSLGMSGDFEVGIEEGATMIRVGTAIFGARPGPGGS